MARFFNSLGKSIENFFDLDKYRLDRTARINVGSGDVHWHLETSLQNDGKVTSELGLTQKFKTETVGITTLKSKNPKLTISSKRYEKVPFTLKVQDPKVTLQLRHQQKKFSVEAETKFDWFKRLGSAEVSFNYQVKDDLNIGATVTGERVDGQINATDYNVAAEYQYKKALIAVQTEKEAETILVGVKYKHNENYDLLGQIDFNRNNNVVEYNLGLEYSIDDNSSLRGVYRNGDNIASLLYCQSLQDNNVKAKVAFNYDFNQSPADRSTLEWKLVFGR